MSTPDATLAALQGGAGVWLRGAPGSGRTHTLRAIAARWGGDAVWLRSPSRPWLSALPAEVLLCLDDAPAGLDRDGLPPGRPAIAAGPRPGEGWEIVELEALSEDESVQLFLRHAPSAGALSAVRALARRLGGNPTALIAAARRWPAERLEAILADPSPGWPGLRAAYDALTAPERDTLALLSRLPGDARREGLVWCGRAHGIDGLITAGWVSVAVPGCFSLPPAVADAIRPWQEGNVTPYFSWFAQEARRRVQAWDTDGGSREWFRAGLWSALWDQPHRPQEPWFFLGWSLSGESPGALLAALDDIGDALPPIVRARCAARAHQASGDRTRAAETLQAALESGTADPHHRALAWLELGAAHQRLRALDDAQAAYETALAEMTALGLRRGRMLCFGNIAAVAHDRGQHEAAQAGYQDAIAEAGALQELRVRGIFSSNLGALLLEIDALDDARAALRQAIRDLTAEPDDRCQAIARVNLAAVELLEGHLEAADTQYRDALALLGDSDPASSALCHARRGAVAALRGALDEARQHHARADALAPAQDPLTVRLVALWRGLLEWQAGDRASALGRRRESLGGAVPLVSTSDEARLVNRLLERLAAEPGAVLLVGPEGAWMRLPGEEPTEVARYAAVARILAHLAQTAEAQPGATSDADALIAAGWPGEQIVPDAAKNRLAVALARLRKLGMRALLQRTRDGWRIDPDWSVMLLRADDPTPTEP